MVLLVMILGRFCLLLVWIGMGRGGREVCLRSGMSRQLGGLLSGWLGFGVKGAGIKTVKFRILCSLFREQGDHLWQSRLG